MELLPWRLSWSLIPGLDKKHPGLDNDAQGSIEGILVQIGDGLEFFIGMCVGGIVR